MTLAKIAADSTRGSFFLLVGQVLSIIIMAVAAILVGRFLGPSLYGEYNLVIVVPQLLLLFADLGMNDGITKFTASFCAEGKRDQAKQIVRCAIIFRMLVGVAIFVVNFVMAGFLAVLINRPEAGFLIQLSSIMIIFQILFQCSNSAFVGFDKAEYDALVTDIQAIFKTVISVSLVLVGFGVAGALVGFVAAYVAAAIAAVCVLFFILLKPIKIEVNTTFKQNLSMLMSFGIPLYASNLVIGFLPLYQRVVLAYFASDASIGNYGVASNFVQLLGTIPLAIATTLLPAFSKLDSLTGEKVKQFFRYANKYTSLLIVPVATLMIILSEEMVEILYGTSYQSAPLFLALVCLPYFLVGIGYTTLSSLFNGLGQTSLTLRVTIINVAIIIVLSPILAGIFSVIGIIFASLASSTIGTIYAVYIARKNFKASFAVGPTIKIYVVAALSSIPTLVLHFSSLAKLLILVIGALLYIFLYMTLIPLAKTLTSHEIQQVARITERIPLLKTIAKPILNYERTIMRIRSND